jgi:hypothetical protein
LLEIVGQNIGKKTINFTLEVSEMTKLEWREYNWSDEVI